MSLDNIIIHDRSDMVKDTWIPDTSFILTCNGWRPLWSITKDDLIITNTYDGKLSLNSVFEVKESYQNTILNQHSFWEFETGEKHKWFGYRRMTKADNSRIHVYDHKPCTNTTKEFHIKNCGVYDGISSDITKEDCSILGWILADGYIKWAKKSFATSSSHGTKRGVITLITQNDNKYGAEIKDLLLKTQSYKSESIRKNTKNVCRDYYIKPEWFREYWIRLGFMQENKHDINLSQFLLKQPRENIESFLDAFLKADGHTTRKGKGAKVITQNQNNLSEGVMLASYLLGYNVTSGEKGGIYINKRGYINICKWYKLGEKPHQTTMRLKTSVLPTKRMIQLTVDGYAVYRQKDIITCA